jgi:hypothetical protein
MGPGMASAALLPRLRGRAGRGVLRQESGYFCAEPSWSTRVLRAQNWWIQPGIAKMYWFSYDSRETPYKIDTIGNPYINHTRASQALHTRVATCHAHIDVPHVCHKRAHHAPRLAPHGPPTVELSGRKLAHGAPRGARARDFVNLRGGIYASRARGAPARV